MTGRRNGAAVNIVFFHARLQKVAGTLRRASVNALRVELRRLLFDGRLIDCGRQFRSKPIPSPLSGGHLSDS